MADIEVASYAFVLFFLYLFLALISAFQIARIIYYGHNIWGWQFGFLAQCVPFSILRAIFFLLIDVLEQSNMVAAFAIYWIPINLQFSTFTLLILFYAHIYYKTEKKWESSYLGEDNPHIGMWWAVVFSRRVLYTTAYVCSNILYLLITVVGVIVVAVHNSQEGWENKMWNIVSAVAFSLLVCVLAYYGLRVASVMRLGKAQISFQPKKSSNIQVISVSAILFLLFTSRAIFNILAATDLIGFAVESGLELNDLGMFALFFVWEIVPTTLVIILFWRIPNPSRKSALMPNTQTPYKVNLLNERDRGIAAKLQPSLFDNPQRYESDDDSPNFGPNARHFLPSNSPYSPYDTNPTPPSYGALGYRAAEEDAKSDRI